MACKSWIERVRASRIQSRCIFSQMFDPGSGTRVYDTDGNSYLDSVSSQVCAVAGHAHPEYADAIARQTHTLIQRGSAFTDTCQIQLAEKVAQLCPCDLSENYFTCKARWKNSTSRSPRPAHAFRSMTVDSLGAPVALLPIEPRSAIASWTAATHVCSWSGMLERGEV